MRDQQTAQALAAGGWQLAHPVCGTGEVLISFVLQANCSTSMNIRVNLPPAAQMPLPSAAAHSHVFFDDVCACRDSARSVSQKHVFFI